jgi:hypothetical protein
LDCCVNGWWYGDLRDTLIECLGIDYLQDPAEWIE